MMQTATTAARFGRGLRAGPADLARWACLAALPLWAAAAAAQAVPNPPLQDPSADDLRDALFPLSERSFTSTKPPSFDGSCPGAAIGTAATAVPALRDKNLIDEPVGYGAAGVPHADLAIQFATNSDAISRSGKKVLDTLAAVLTEEGVTNVRFAVAGHTDATGLDKINLELSCARALAVRNYLIGRGVAAQRLGAFGFGSRKPLQPGVQASEVNRRVEIRREK